MPDTFSDLYSSLQQSDLFGGGGPEVQDSVSTDDDFWARMDAWMGEPITPMSQMQISGAIPGTNERIDPFSQPVPEDPNVLGAAGTVISKAFKDALVGDPSSVTGLTLKGGEGFDEGGVFTREEGVFDDGYQHSDLLTLLGGAASAGPSTLRALFNKIPGAINPKETKWGNSDTYFEIADATWNELTAAEGDFAAAVSKKYETGMDIPFWAAQAPFVAVNAINPLKLVKGIVVGAKLTTKAAMIGATAVAGTGAYKAATRFKINQARKAGSMVDAGVSGSKVGDAIGGAVHAWKNDPGFRAAAKSGMPRGYEKLTPDQALDLLDESIQTETFRYLDDLTSHDVARAESAHTLATMNMPGHPINIRTKLMDDLYGVYRKYDDIFEKYNKFPTNKAAAKADDRVFAFQKELEYVRENYAREVYGPASAASPVPGVRLGFDEAMNLELGPEIDHLFRKYNQVENIWRKETLRIEDKFRSRLKKSRTKEAAIYKAIDRAVEESNSPFRKAMKEGMEELRLNMQDFWDNPLTSDGPVVSLVPELSPAKVGAEKFLENLAVSVLVKPKLMPLQAKLRQMRASTLFDDELLDKGIFLYERTGDPRFSKLDTYEDLLGRYQSHPQFKEFVEYLDAWKQLSKQALAKENEINKLFGRAPTRETEDYIHRAYKDFGGYADPKKARKFRTLRDAVVDGGLEPLSYDVSKMIEAGEHRALKIAPGERIIYDLLSVNNTLDGDSLFLRLADHIPDGLSKQERMMGIVDKIPEGYVDISKTAFDGDYISRIGQVLPGDGGKILMKEGVYKQLGYSLSRKAPPSNLYTMAQVAKRLNFLGTLFHAYTLTESAVNIMGPVQGIQMAASLGFGMPWLSSRIRKLGPNSTISKMLGGQTMQEAEARAIAHLVNVDAPKFDVRPHKWDEIAGKGAKFVEKKVGKVLGPKAGKVAASPVNAARYLQRTIDDALWDSYHHPMKVIAFNAVFDDLLATKANKGKRVPKFIKKDISKMSDAEIGREVGKFINDEFGGQNWEAHTSRFFNKFFGNKEKMQKAATLFLSPDWNISSMRASLAIAQMIPGTRASNPVRGLLGARHWKNAAIGVYGGANVFNYMMTSLFSPDGEGNFMWDNPLGKKGHMVIGYDDGKPIYGAIGKQYKELFSFIGWAPPGVSSVLHPKPPQQAEFFAPMEFLIRKTVPLWQATTMPFVSSSGYKKEIIRRHEIAIREGKDLGSADYLWQYAKGLAESMRPFMVGGGERIWAKTGDVGKTALYTALPFPKSSGTTLFQGKTALTEAFRNDDEKMFLFVLESLYDSGHNDTEIADVIDEALKKAKRYPTSGKLEPKKEE